MRDFNDLVKIIQKIVIETVNTNYPLSMMYGTVISTSPLKINVEQKMVLDAPFLMLSKSVTYQSTSIIIDGQTKTITLTNALKVGEQVVLLRQQGGQKFLVLDRVVKT